MDITTLALVIGFGLILLGVTFIGYSSSFIDSHQVSQRLKTFVVDDVQSSQTPLNSFREINYSESIFRRIIVPIIAQVITYFGRFAPKNTITEVNRKLSVAGINSLRAQQFYGIRAIFLLLGIVGSILLYPRYPTTDFLLVSAAVILVLFILPILWLRMRVISRQDAIQRSIPDALDMLAVSTAAGLGFEQALMKVSQYFKTAAAQEFARVVSEIEVGVSRQDALRNFSDRVRVHEISSFTAVIIQSEILGMSIADVLHSQAEQMRVQRQYRAKEAAQRLPVKMMVPLVFLILPALLAVLLGPTIPAILELF